MDSVAFGTTDSNGFGESCLLSCYSDLQSNQKMYVETYLRKFKPYFIRQLDSFFPFSTAVQDRNGGCCARVDGS